MGDEARALRYAPRRVSTMELAVNEQVFDKPKNRWWWIVAIVVLLVPILWWGFQTAIQMEEGPADAGAPSAPAS